ncbi:hypothetical protein [Burkholderia sp. LMG 13014]|uniref:hypothetical protein n=1 Tax=Burkholderia sp. LMG 13014 TaxID=2709306 RepID=UPI001F052287|nr:hypothetical protein [Burkholderia sp. LMG 13014]
MVIPDTGRLALPARVFAEAVRLAAAPRRPIEDLATGEGLRREAVQSQYAAVDHLTAWWNETAPADLRGAFSFTPYVKVDVGWASGDREEGYVSEETMLRARGRRGEAMVLDSIVIVFYRTPMMNAHRWFSAPSVDGGHGVEASLPDWLSAEELLSTDAYDALHGFPSRFGELWVNLQNS